MALAEAPPYEPPTSRMPERWRPRGADTNARLRSWSDILAATHLAFDVLPTYRTPKRFVAAVTRRPLGDLMLVDCAVAPFAARRDAALVGAHGPGPDEDVFALQFVVRGVEVVGNTVVDAALKSA